MAIQSRTKKPTARIYPARPMTGLVNPSSRTILGALAARCSTSESHSMKYRGVSRRLAVS